MLLTSNKLTRTPFLTKAIATIITIAAMVTTSVSVNASGEPTNNIRWNGFINQGFSYSDENNFLGESSKGSFKFSSAALNGSWRPLSQLQVSAQALYLENGKNDKGGIELDFAIIDWRVYNSMNSSFGIRAGRLKNPYGFFNETRDLASSRPGILLPESIYVDHLRDLIHSSDSGGVYGHHTFNQGTLSINATKGTQSLSDQTENAVILFEDVNGDLENIDIEVSQIGFEHFSGTWRVAYSHVEYDADFNPAPTDRVFPGGVVDTTQQLLSLEYNWGKWQFVGEYQLRDFTLKDIYFPGVSLVMDTVGYFAQVSYQLDDKWQLFLRRDDVYLNKNDKSGQKFQQDTGAPAHLTYAKDHTIGIRYIHSQNWQFNAELHNILGTFWLPDNENPSIPDQEPSWNLLLLQAAYRF